MIKQQYAVLDMTANVFLNSLVFTNNADAIRWFTTVVNSEEKDNNISKYPGQFLLFRLADYDDQTGCYVARPNEDEKLAMKPKELISGGQCKEESDVKFTVKELIQMLKAEVNKDNIIDIAEGVK
jgi:hypothetical protein